MDFIPGLCRIYARRLNSPYWTKLPYAPRGYHECQQVVDYYGEEWGNLYDYVITADHDLCAPKPVVLTQAA